MVSSDIALHLLCLCPYKKESLIYVLHHGYVVERMASHPLNPSCIFCRIIERKEPAHVIAETQEAIAFLDKYPVSLGHTLVVSKHHYENIFDIPGSLLSEMILLAKRIAIAQQKALGATGVKIVMNNGKTSGQEIFHAHIHVIPSGTPRQNRAVLDEETGGKIAQLLREALKEIKD
jgi:histidine triad (HIT) family protein